MPCAAPKIRLIICAFSRVLFVALKRSTRICMASSRTCGESRRHSAEYIVGGAVGICGWWEQHVGE
eukprot:7106203-Prymnesium_polylepis.1